MVEKERPNQIINLMCHDQGDKIDIDKMFEKDDFQNWIHWVDEG
jgi:hypothetical protein